MTLKDQIQIGAKFSKVGRGFQVRSTVKPETLQTMRNLWLKLRNHERKVERMRHIQESTKNCVLGNLYLEYLYNPQNRSAENIDHSVVGKSTWKSRV